MTTDVIIANAARTPIGAFGGALASVAPANLGTIAIKEALTRAGVAPEDVSEVILGHVLTAAQGQNPARQASIRAGLPDMVPAYTINHVCGSGLKAVGLAAQAIRAGDSSIVVAGGQESMSQAPHTMYLRNGTKMGDTSMIDTMIRDGLWDAFNGYHMGNTAENVAEKYQISREEQDEFACWSQNKAEAAMKSGRFADEIVPVTIKGRKGDTVVDQDEYPRHGSTIEAMAKLRPAFTKDGIRDRWQRLRYQRWRRGPGDDERRRGQEAWHSGLARIASFAQAGVDPALMGTGPIPRFPPRAGTGRLGC